MGTYIGQYLSMRTLICQYWFMRAFVGHYWSMGTHIVGSTISSMGHHRAMLAALNCLLRYISDGWLVANVLKVNPQNVQLPST